MALLPDERSEANTTLGFIASGIAQGPFAGKMIRGAQDAAWHKLGGGILATRARWQTTGHPSA